VKHARKAVTAVGHAVKTVVKHVGNAAKAVGKGLVEAGKFVGNAIVTAAKKTWEGIKAAAVFVAKLACKAVAGFLDTVVKGAVRGMMEMGKWAVYAGGKLVAAVLKNAFNIQLIQYTASIQGLIRANLGKFRVKAIVLGIKLDFELELALLRWAGIGEEADIQEGSERHLEAIPGEVIVRPQEDVAAEPEPHGYLMTEQMDEALAYSMAGHNVNDFMPTGGVLLGSQPSRRLLTADDSVNLHDEQVQDVQGRSEETGTAEWGGGRRRRSWIHRHHKHHSHHPHRHHRHHSHHAHTPHKHHKHHAHTPHKHSPSPTLHPTHVPTRTPTKVPVRPPTAKPSSEPKTDTAKASKNFEKAGHKASCKVLDKMGYGRSCDNGERVSTEPVDITSVEEELERQFNIRHGSMINLINQQTKTFVHIEDGNRVGVTGSKEDTSCTFTVHVPGGKSVHFGAYFTLKSSCNGKYLGRNSAGEIRAEHNSEGSATTKFQIFSVVDTADRSATRDFTIVGIKSHDGHWLGTTSDAKLLANRRAITDGSEVLFSIYKLTKSHPVAPQCSKNVGAPAAKLISTNKPASQSSEGWAGKASRAVDGKTDGRYGHGSCTHTQSQHRAWWKVDLGASYNIHRVVVWNRADCCATRLNNFEVLADGHKCGTIGTARTSNTVQCNNQRAATVTVRLTGTNYLTLCEVQVYASSSATGSSGLKSLGLHSGWAPYGHGYVAPKFVINGNICVVSGLIKGTGTHLTTLPVGCRPNKRIIFNLNNHQNTLRVDVLVNGQVHRVAGTFQHGWINLDGIQFSVRDHKPVALHNGWGNYGHDYKTATYTKYSHICEVEGLIKGSQWGHAMAVLPSDCRPRKRLIFNLNNHAKTCRVDVQTNGHVTWHAGGRDHSWVSLGGIMFATDAGRHCLWQIAGRTMVGHMVRPP
jgi:hypothetical protein